MNGWLGGWMGVKAVLRIAHKIIVSIVFTLFDIICLFVKLFVLTLFFNLNHFFRFFLETEVQDLIRPKTNTKRPICPSLLCKRNQSLFFAGMLTLKCRNCFKVIY